MEDKFYEQKEIKASGLVRIKEFEQANNNRSQTPRQKRKQVYRNTVYKTVFTQDAKQPNSAISIQYNDKSLHEGKKHSISLRNLEMKKYKQKEIKPNMGLISGGVATQEISGGSAGSSIRNIESAIPASNDIYLPTETKKGKSTILERQRTYANNSTNNLESISKKASKGLGSISFESIQEAESDAMLLL